MLPTLMLVSRCCTFLGRETDLVTKPLNVTLLEIDAVESCWGRRMTCSGTNESLRGQRRGAGRPVVDCWRECALFMSDTNMIGFVVERKRVDPWGRCRRGDHKGARSLESVLESSSVMSGMGKGDGCVEQAGLCTVRVVNKKEVEYEGSQSGSPLKQQHDLPLRKAGVHIVWLRGSRAVLDSVPLFLFVNSHLYGERLTHDGYL